MSFLSIPSELQIMILTPLNAFELLELRQVSQGVKRLVDNETFWTPKLRGLIQYVGANARQDQKGSPKHVFRLMKSLKDLPLPTLLESFPHSLKEEHTQVVAGLLIKDHHIVLEGTRNQRYSKFVVLREILLRYGPIDLTLNNLGLKDISFLDDPITQRKISCLTLTRDAIDDIKSLKAKMNFFEDGIPDHQRDQSSTLMFLSPKP